MALTFDYVDKHIHVPQLDAQPLLMQALVNAIREEEASERGITYDQITDASGKDALGGGIMTGITVALRSSWKIEFSAGAYQATLTGGNLADALSRIFNTGSPQVLVQASSASTLVETGVSGLTTTESAQLAAAAAGSSDPADIAAAVRAELATELARIDVATGTRVASGSTVPANVKQVNDVPLAGVGTSGDPWRPA